jgi:hypothetical protein
MTVANQITYVKRLARADSGYLTETDTDDVARRYINTGVEEFVKAAHGPTKEDYIDITPEFDTRTTWYIRLTITAGTNAIVATDVAVTTTNRDNVSGTTVASDLQTTIRAALGGGGASLTVVWSTTTWRFTIDSIDGTDIKIEAPSGITFIDATQSLFGRTGASGAQTWVSNFPEDCTIVADLPSDFYKINFAEWDKRRLYQIPFAFFMSPGTHSNLVDYYAIEGKRIYISPSASERKLFKLRYEYFPASITLDGTADATTSCPLSHEDHMAVVYYATGMVLDETFESDESNRMLQRFNDQASKYRIKEANQNTKMFPKNAEFFIPKVEM